MEDLYTRTHKRWWQKAKDTQIKEEQFPLIN